ncbi:MAG: hypothetical protein KTR19_13285 [Hyphomicrobiales bacterium]|nr:hypothetical protein [Hyphomicrobiales bacterium]
MIKGKPQLRHSEDEAPSLSSNVTKDQEYYHRAPVSGGSDTPISKLNRVARQLETLIEEETEALRNQKSSNFSELNIRELNIRKNRDLLELEAAVTACLNAGVSEDIIRSSLSGLRAKLAQNQSLLQMHVRAVREVSSIISAAIAEADSDGTYSMAVRFGSNR